MARIGIAGAGIAGLGAAAGLAQAGHDVTIFDEWEQPKPVGSGLVIQPVGLAVLDVLGVGHHVRQLGQPLTAMQGHEASSGRTILNVTYDPEGQGRKGLALHRASLHQALLDEARSQRVRFELGARVTARDGQCFIIHQQRTAPFDLLVDAAGARSALSPLQAKPLPYGAIWGVVRWPQTDLPADTLTQRYRRADRMIGVLPIGRITPDDPPLAALFWSLPRDQHDDWCAQTLDTWRAETTAMWPEVAPFVEQISSHSEMTMARYSHGSLSRPYAPGMVHLGDAAHRASPQLGQGANMALLDALALIRAVEAGPLAEAGARMWNARRAHVWTYQALSAAFTPQYQSDSQVLPYLRDHILAPVSQAWPADRVLPRLVRGTLVPPVMAGLGPLEPATI